MKAAIALLFALPIVAQSTIPNNPGTRPTVVIRNATIHTVSSGVIPKGSVVIRDGRIESVGASAMADVEGAQIIDATGLHVYPGMIDSGTSIGLTEISSVHGTTDVIEVGDFNAHLSTFVALNPHTNLIPVTRVNGVLLALSQPEGGMVSGASSLIRMSGWTPEEMAVKRNAAMHFRLPQALLTGASLTRDEEAEKERREGYDERLKDLRELMRDAVAYRTALDAAPRVRINDRDLVLEGLAPVLRGEIPAIFHANREADIREAIRFAEEHKLKAIISGGHDSAKVVDELKKRDIPVLLGPILALPQREDDPYDLLFTNAKKLHDAGVRFAILSGDDHNSRNLPYHAAAAAAFDLPREAALRAITLSPAEIFGIADRYGSLEPGKSATLFIADGDPLEIRTQVRHLFIEGEMIPLDSRHTDLYRKFANRPQ